MKEYIINFLVKWSRPFRKILDFLLYKLYLNPKNNWNILYPYLDKDVLIVGNGPSLNKTPLEKINMVSIGMNKINLLYDKTSWRPNIIACTNGLVLKQNKDFFNTTNTILLVPTMAYYLGIKKRKNVLFFRLTKAQNVNGNITTSISEGYTVTFLCLQLAAHLKPKSVNIVGVDHSFSFDKTKTIYKLEGEDSNHFSKDYFKNSYWGVPDLEGSEKNYTLAKNYFNSVNTPIIDYTIGGKLTVFKKGDINEITNNVKK